MARRLSLEAVQSGDVHVLSRAEALLLIERLRDDKSLKAAWKALLGMKLTDVNTPGGEVIGYNVVKAT